MWAWIIRIFGLLFGGDKQSATDQQLGRIQQERDDAIVASQEDHHAQEIDEADSRLTHDELVDSLRGPQGPNNPSR